MCDEIKKKINRNSANKICNDRLKNKNKFILHVA